MAIFPPYKSIDREAIWSALFEQLKSSVGSEFVSIGRKHKAPPDLLPAQQPALFLVEAKETHLQKPAGLPQKIALHGFLIIYFQASDLQEEIGAETELPATKMNAFLQAIDDALAPDDRATDRFTLGGLVTHCWIEGDTSLDPAILGPQAAAIVPLHILVP